LVGGGLFAAGLLHYFQKTVVAPADAGVPAAALNVTPTKEVPSTPSDLSLESWRRHQEILEQEIAALRADRGRLEAELKRSRSDNEDLHGAVAEAIQRNSGLAQQLQTVSAAQAKAENDLSRLRSQRDSDQIAIQAQNKEIASLNEKLQEESAQRAREQDILAAETKIHELVGARNLHIVDVFDTYETDGHHGKTEKAVGRIFFKEGESLVFYAYDLSKTRAKSGKYVYYVWGHRNDVDNVRSLGALGEDDPAQSRWMLKTNDAQALANIDRVFVTLEQAGKISARPSGQKILSAYLGAPANHP
jgi:hypothetical protein